MLIAPPTCVGGIDTDDRNTAARCHRGQTITELGGGNTGHGAPELFAMTTTTQRFATRGTGIGKVEVLHRDRHTMIALRYVQQLRDRRAQVPVTVGGMQLLDLEGDRVTQTD